MFNRIVKDLQLIADINNFRDLPYICKIAGNEPERKAARQLQAQVYLEKGNISKGQITHEGMLDSKTDAFAEQSTYFVVQKTDEDNRVVGAARQINHIQDKGFDSFQIFSKANISEPGAEFINQFNPEKTVEVSGLVKYPGEALIIPMYLYRQMWRYSVVQKHELWVMVITDHLYHRIKPIFGQVIREVGEEHQLPHSNNHIVPASLEINKAEQSFARERDESSGARKVILDKLYDFFFTEV